MSSSSTLFVGVDVAKNWLDCSVNGSHQRIDNTCKPISSFLATLPSGAVLVYEATGGYERSLENVAVSLGFVLKRVPPTRVRSFAKACGLLAKTDRIDAHLLARFGAFDASPARELPHARLHALNHRRDQLASMLQAERNRLNRMPESVLSSVLRIVAVLENELRDVEAQIVHLIESDAILCRKKALLCSVKGVGSTVSAALLAALPELGNRDGKTLAALVGVAPQTRESGLKKCYARTGYGRSNVRKALYMAALVAMRHNPPLKAFYDKLRAAGKPGKVALMACMRKLLVILNAIIKSDSPWKFSALPS
jgi:transposase